MKNLKYILLLILFFLAGPARAESVFISNNITTSANTGGSSTDQSSGSAHSSVFIQTKVNGQVVEEVNQEASGEQAQLDVKSIVKTAGDKVKVDTKVRNQGEVTSTTKVVPLKSPAETEKKESQKEIEDRKEVSSPATANNSPEQKEKISQRLEIFNIWRVVSSYIDNLVKQFKIFIYLLF